MHHPQVVQSPIVNDFLKVKIDGHAEPQLVPEFLLRLPVRELHKNLVSEIYVGGMKEVRDAENNIIISDSILRSLLPLQLKKCKVMRGWECFTYAKSIHYSLLSWRDC